MLLQAELARGRKQRSRQVRRDEGVGLCALTLSATVDISFLWGYHKQVKQKAKTTSKIFRPSPGSTSQENTRLSNLATAHPLYRLYSPRQCPSTESYFAISLKTTWLFNVCLHRCHDVYTPLRLILVALR